MARINRINILRIICFSLLLMCTFLQLKLAVIEQTNFNNIITGDQIHTSSLSPQLLTSRAKNKHLLDADIPAATSLLQLALTENPFYIPAWLSLAEVYNDLGNKRLANDIVDYLNTLTHDINRWRWEKVLLVYQLGKAGILQTDLRYIIQNIPGRTRNDAIRMAFSLWKEPETMLQKVGDENLIHLFHYAVDHADVESALYFWREIERAEIACSRQQIIAFVNMLLGTNTIATAGEIWKKRINPSHIEFNGVFAEPFIQKAFGWHNVSDKAFDLYFENDQETNSGNVLHYIFKGNGNIEFRHLWQIVPFTTQGHFKLSMQIKTKKLSTDQRPYFESYGYNCETTQTKSEMFGSSHDWQEYSFDINVGGDCKAVIIVLRRNTSSRLDNKLSGQLWLKNITITPKDNPVVHQ